MFNFINPYAPPKIITGVERAEFDRYHVFKRNHVPVRLVSLQFNQFLAVNAQSYGIDLNDVCNLYDYFCGINYANHAEPISVVPEDADDSKQDGLLTRYFLDGQVIRKVRRAADESIISVYDYNQNRESRCVTFYRPNGEAAMRQWFNHSGNYRTEYLDQTGRVCLSFHYSADSNVNAILLRDWEQHTVRMFNDEATLAGYFLDSIVAAEPGQTFITDHSSDLLPALHAMQMPVPKFAFIHAMVKTSNGQVSGYYAPLAKEIHRWQGAIVSTAQQAQDVKRLWPDTPVFHANVSVVSKQNLQAAVPSFAQRAPNALFMLARVDPAKDLGEAVKILELVRENLPICTLEIWGSARIPAFADYRDQLDQLIKERRLTDVVHFRGYTPTPEQIIDHARLLLVTSRSEGTALVINEALARMVPVVSLKFDYGPKEFIRDGDNGYLVARDDLARAARCCLELLRNERLWSARAKAARKKARRFDVKHSWQQWQKIIRAMEEMSA